MSELQFNPIVKKHYQDEIDNFVSELFRNAGITLYAEHRHAQLQKARMEIAEGSKKFCKYCNSILSDNDIDEFTDLCIGCYIWRT